MSSVIQRNSNICRKERGWLSIGHSLIYAQGRSKAPKRALQKETYQLKSTGISLFDLVSGAVY